MRLSTPRSRSFHLPHIRLPRAAIALLLALTPCALAACSPTGALSRQPFESAADSAARRDTLLVAAFHASWCGPCRQMERQTWPDPAVAEWLGRHAVAVRIDADARPDLRERFDITALPTVLVIRDDREVARMTGRRSPANLLDFLESSRAGRTRLQQLAAAIAAEPDPDRLAELRIEALDEAIRTRDAAAAAEHWRSLWPGRGSLPFESRHTLRHHADGLAKLPAARPLVQDAREKLHPGAMASQLDDESLEDWIVLSRALGDHRAVADWYADAPHAPDRADALRRNYDGVWNTLVAARRYDAVLALTGDDPARYARLSFGPDAVTGPGVNIFNRRSILRQSAVPRLVGLYEACLGAGRPEDAAQVRAELLRHFPDPETRTALDKAAHRSHDPTE